MALKSGICVDVVPVGETGYALRPYGYTDAFRGAVSDEATHFLEQPVGQWMEKRGVVAADLENSADLQAAKLFPVTDNLEEMERLLHWLSTTIPMKRSRPCGARCRVFRPTICVWRPICAA